MVFIAEINGIIVFVALFYFPTRDWPKTHSLLAARPSHGHEVEALQFDYIMAKTDFTGRNQITGLELACKVAEREGCGSGMETLESPRSDGGSEVMTL